ncbi:hypothetical protein [Actinomadura sp. 7K534]|uniref:hypothetical protein n=1 Tax=Actinomadura sp. 7K534 TaxID=2530366 RepID=UPI001048CEEA|nr:hypothetical protein [Actinomadura sp. 7K534]TDB87601.1 hypothetical protein E1266_32520 [Actinomadura sp. 7K534]
MAGFDLSPHHRGRPVAGSAVDLFVPLAGRVASVRELAVDALRSLPDGVRQFPGRDAPLHMSEAPLHLIRQSRDVGITAELVARTARLGSQAVPLARALSVRLL